MIEKIAYHKGNEQPIKQECGGISGNPSNHIAPANLFKSQMRQLYILIHIMHIKKTNA